MNWGDVNRKGVEGGGGCRTETGSPTVRASVAAMPPRITDQSTPVDDLSEVTRKQFDENR